MTASGGSYHELMDDSLDRLHRYYDGSANRWLYYDGPSLIAEYGSGGTVLRRFVHGPGVDEPLVWYEGSGTSDRRWLHADERGSVIAISNGSGSVTNINAYDEYGIPASGNAGRFQYTGQQWLPEVGMQYSRARFYSPTLGRFLQTDPIGFGGGMNIYAYVGNDPVNRTDPTGLYPVCELVDKSHTAKDGTIVVELAVGCYDNGLSITSIDQQVVNYVSLHIQPEETHFSSLNGLVIPVLPTHQTQCAGSPVISYSIPQSAYQGGDPGHIHGTNFVEGLGPDDGMAARQGGTGTTFVGGIAGAYRVNRLGPTNYSVSLLSGNWGMSESQVISLVSNWNQYDGQNSALPEAQGGAAGSGAVCTTTPVP